MRKTKLSTRLTKARALLADRNGWTYNSFRRKSSNTADGFSYCALGACAKIVGGFSEDGGPAADLMGVDPEVDRAYHEMRHALNNCSVDAGFRGIVYLNDMGIVDGKGKRTPKRRHTDVLAAFDCAISKAKAAEKAARAAV